MATTPLKSADITAWLQEAQPGERLIYGTESAAFRPKSDVLAAARSAFEEGLVHLFPKRRLGRIDYIAERRPPPAEDRIRLGTPPKTAR